MKIMNCAHACVITALFTIHSQALATQNVDMVIEIDSRDSTIITEASPFAKVISQEDILRTGAKSLSEVLALSGVLYIAGASSGYGASGAPDMRGFGERAGQNILILLDGRPLNNATLEGPDLSTIPVASISKIEIFNASAGVLYGDGAVGGVLNIISDQASPKELREINLSSGSFGTSEFSSSISTNLKNGGNLYLSTSGQTTDGYRDYTSSTKSYGAASYSIPITNGNISVGMDQHRTDGYLSGIVLDSVATMNRKAFRANSVQEKRSLRQTLWSKLERSIGDETLFQADLGRRISSQEGGYPLGSGSIDQLLAENSISPKVINRTSLFGKENDIVLGLDFSQSKYLTGTSNVRKQQVTSWYGRSNLKMEDDVNTIIGARITNAEDELLNGTKSDHNLRAFEIGLEKSINDQLISIRLDQSYRIATLDEQVRYPAPSYTAVDTQIAPQDGSSIELGWKSNNHQASIYHLINNGEIYYDQLNGINTTVGQTNRSGVSMGSELEIDETLSATLNGTYVYANFNDGTYSGKHIPATSKLFGSLLLNKSLSDKWSLNVSSRYQSAQYSINDHSNAYGRRNAYFDTDFSLIRSGKIFSAKATVTNIFDKEYDAYHLVSGGTLYRTPSEPRTLFFEIFVSM